MRHCNMFWILVFTINGAYAQERLDNSLEHWQNINRFGEAKIVDDEVHLISTKNWFLLTQKRYSDFELTAEVLMPDVKEYSNSGILFRAAIAEKNDETLFAYGYQAEVDPSARKWSGGLYEQGAPRQWLHPIHKTRSHSDHLFKKNFAPFWDDKKSNAYQHLQWNRYKIRAIGSNIKIWVNDVLTTHVNDEKFSNGFIGIQHHGSATFKQSGVKINTVKYRNILVTDLSKR